MIGSLGQSEPRNLQLFRKFRRRDWNRDLEIYSFPVYFIVGSLCQSGFGNLQLFRKFRRRDWNRDLEIYSFRGYFIVGSPCQSGFGNLQLFRIFLRRESLSIGTWKFTAFPYISRSVHTRNLLISQI